MPKEYRETCLTRLLMSRMFRRYVESVIVFWFPWVLLSEQEAKTMEGQADEPAK